MATSPYVADVSGFARGVQGFLSDRINQRLQEKALEGDQQALTRLSSRDPRAAQTIGGIFQQQEQSAEKTKQEEQAAMAGVARGYSQADDKKAYLQSVSGILRQRGLERLAGEVDDDILTYDTNPDAVNNEYITANLMFSNPDAFNMSVSQQEFEANIQEFSEEEKLRARKIKAGLEARAVGSGAITTATTEGLTEKVAESEEEIKERTKFAELTGSSRAKAIDSGVERIEKINQNIGNYDRALSALDDGAATGAIESRFFPSIKAASVALDQIQNELTLDVLNAATFGALSEEELKLAKQTALPTGLDPKELRKFLIDKKAAQEKLKAYLDEQVQFLDAGGTVAGFLRSKRREGRPQAAASTQPQIIEVDY